MADSHQQQRAADAVKTNRDPADKHGDQSPSRALAVAMLLVLSSTALAASIAVAVPLFLLFSPVALTAMGMVVSGALALGGLALLSRLETKAAASPTDYVEAKRRVAGDKAPHVAAGQAMQSKGQDVAGHMAHTP